MKLEKATDYLRWVVPDLLAALEACSAKNFQGICCTLDVLGENVKSEKQALLASEAYLTTAQELDAGGLDGGIAIKLSNLGANFDRSLARKNLLNIYKRTEDFNVNLELDMEGTQMVDYTIESAIECSKKDYHVTMALQAYLGISKDDIKTALEHEITVRVVKGAYLGDTDDFAEIQKRFMTLVELLLKSGRHFTIGTHDPELIEWIKEQAVEQKELIEFGFLKGLADQTKLELVEDGWAVVEYIPVGYDYKAYVTRRERYLKELDRLGRQAVP